MKVLLLRLQMKMHPLDCKIKQVNPKGSQSWIFTGKTDAKAETNTLDTWCKELTH